MTAESITASLEWAKKLVSAGYPQHPCLFYWDSHAIQKTQQSEGYGFGITEDGEFAAPTAEEILRRFPPVVRTSDDTGIPHMHYFPSLEPSHFTVGYCGDKKVWVTHKGTMLCFEDGSLANAAAAMYCYLANNKLLPKQ